MLGVRIPPGLPSFCSQAARDADRYRDRTTNRPMKKGNQKAKKSNAPKKRPPGNQKQRIKPNAGGTRAKSSKPKPSPVQANRKAVVRKGEEKGKVAALVSKAGQFLREAKVELKKVKWPTRRELLASTAVVIVLTLFVAFFLGLVDFGLIKILKNIVG